MESLQYLHLEQTDLSGPIPPEIGRLTNLEELYLSETCTFGYACLCFCLCCCLYFVLFLLVVLLLVQNLLQGSSVRCRYQVISLPVNDHDRTLDPLDTLHIIEMLSQKECEKTPGDLDSSVLHGRIRAYEDEGPGLILSTK